MKRLFSILLAIAITTISSAQNPVFHTYEYEDQSIIQGMSDNGTWAVASGGEEADARLINLDTQKATIISTASKAESARDVTNDGVIVVGSQAAKPAYYNAQTEEWTYLQTQSPYVYGCAYSITPDGRYAVGVIYYEDGMDSKGAMWDMETGKLISLEGLPAKDMSHQDQDQMHFIKISADARYILGCMSFSYLPTSEDLGGCFYFVYNVETQDYKPIGFTETKAGRWTPLVDGLIVVMDAYMSNNGKYVTGKAHLAKEIEGADYANEYSIPYLYEVERDRITGYDETAVSDTYGSLVTNNGVVIDVTPESTPVREWSIRNGRYWFSFAEILRQKYNTTIDIETGYSNTGTVNGISDDGKRLASFPDPYCSYVVDLPESVETIGDGIKLLGSYNPSPAEGSEVSHLKNITVTFGRSILAVGGSNSAQILDSEENVVYNSVGFNAEGKDLNIRFRTGTLNDGEEYYLFIPEGTVAMSDDATQTNSDIYIMYKGRNDEPVTVTQIYPADGTAFSHIDYSTSPVILTFNTDIAITDTATAYIFRNDESSPYCSLTLARSGKQLALYPDTRQYLYDGSTYRILVSQGAVTDVAGNNPNEEIIVNYVGNYKREISPDDIILFSDNFDNGLGNFMLWCGDKNTPTEEMKDWDFTQGMAWGLVREDESSAERMTASHSMYSPAGESDDWLVIPQIYIPDMLCSVKFLSQSYKFDKTDVLKVIVWESDNVYNTLTQDIVDKMQEEGKVVYEKVQSPGQTEESLVGEWTYNTIDLADFAEKNVYIAFVNQNSNQSAIFMDSLEVRHDMHFLTSFNYEENIVAQESLVIKGTVIGNNENAAYDNLTMILKDALGEVVDTYTASGLNLKKNAKHSFQFAKALPLTIGVENEFSVEVRLDDEKNTVRASVKDLAFKPVKRVVLEEYTGRACGNCPLGILAIEKIQERYGNSFIPVSIHTYNNDPLSYGLSSYTSLLGIDQLGAPSGTVNRGDGCYPAASAEVDGVARYYYTNTETPDETDKLWMDYVNDEMEKPAESEINISSAIYNTATSAIDTQISMRYAMNASNLTVNVFTVLVEDNVPQAQSNYMSSVSSPDLGEWGLGGKYGESVVKDYLHQDVCRNVLGTTINGTGGYLPSAVDAGKEYTATISIPVSSIVSDVMSCKVIVMMIDANTGKVINAAREKVGTTGVEDVLSTGLTQYADGTCWNLSGQKVNTNYRGIVIINGKKILK